MKEKIKEYVNKNRAKLILGFFVMIGMCATFIYAGVYNYMDFKDSQSIIESCGIIAEYEEEKVCCSFCKKEFDTYNYTLSWEDRCACNGINHVSVKVSESGR